MALRAAFVAMLVQTITAHYMWMRHNPHEVFITFSEDPAHSDNALFLKHAENRTSVRVCTEPGIKHELSLTFHELHTDKGALVAPLSVGTFMSLEGEAVWGLFPQIDPKDPPLLKYWFSAPTVTNPSDWLLIDRIDTNRLSVTLRRGVAECYAKEPTNTPVQIVTRFNFQYIGNVSVKLFDGKTGVLVNTVTTSPLGVAMIELPSDRPAFALINHQVCMACACVLFFFHYLCMCKCIFMCCMCMYISVSFLRSFVPCVSVRVFLLQHAAIHTYKQ